MMYDYFNVFFFGTSNSANSISEQYKINKEWAGINIFYELLALVMGRFKYHLYNTMDDRFYELSLLCDGVNGSAQGLTGVVNGKVGYGNQYSEYGYYNNVQLMDYTGKSIGRFIPDCPGNVEPDCVLAYDNKFNIPPIFRIKWYANRLTEIQGSISSAISNLRGSVVITCSEEQAPAVERAWRKSADGTPVILYFGDQEGGLGQEPSVMFNNQTGEVLKQLQEAYDKTMADFLTEFGINANGVINKLSGVSGTELKQNDQARRLNLYNALNSRKEGIEKLNKMYSKVVNDTATVELSDALQEQEADYGQSDVSELE